MSTPRLRDLYISVKTLYLAGVLSRKQKYAALLRIRKMINRREVTV